MKKLIKPVLLSVILLPNNTHLQTLVFILYSYSCELSNLPKTSSKYPNLLDVLYQPCWRYAHFRNMGHDVLLTESHWLSSWVICQLQMKMKMKRIITSSFEELWRSTESQWRNIIKLYVSSPNFISLIIIVGLYRY